MTVPRLEEVKKDVRKSISHAMGTAKDMLQKDIDCNNINQLTYASGASDEVGGMIIVLSRLFPEDSDVSGLLKDANSARNTYYQGKERFLKQCECKKKQIQKKVFLIRCDCLTNKVVLLEFFLEYCGACKMQDPILEDLRRSAGDKVDIIKVSVTENRDMASNFNINATPTMFIIKDNNILKQYIGVTSKDQLESAINQAAGIY